MVYLAEWELSRDNFRITHPDEPPPQAPPLLQEYWRFRRYGLPPLAGGLRDQPVNWFEHAELLERAYSAWSAWMAGDKGPDWRKAHADVMPLIKWLRELVYG